MFDGADPAGPGGIASLLAACVLAGLSLGLLVYALGVTARRSSGQVTAMIDDAQRAMRRERAKQESATEGMLMGAVSILLPLVRSLPLDSVRQSLSERYARAGWPGGYKDDEIFTMSLLIGLLIGIPLMIIIAAANPLAAPLGLIGVLVGPGLVSSHYSSRGIEREKSIGRTMPFVLDLLVLTMRAGASLQIAMERVTQDYAHHPIGEEFRSTLQDIELGVPMKDAFRNMARRVPLPVIRTFVDDLIQSEELGRPLAETLERLSDQVRVRRVQDAVDTAGKSKVMVLVPGMLVFIATLIVLFAPFVMRFVYSDEFN